MRWASRWAPRISAATGSRQTFSVESAPEAISSSTLAISSAMPRLRVATVVTIGQPSSRCRPSRSIRRPWRWAMSYMLSASTIGRPTAFSSRISRSTRRRLVASATADHHVGRRLAGQLAQHRVAGDHLVGAAGAQGIGAGQVQDRQAAAAGGGDEAFLPLDGDAGVVGHLLAAAGQGVEQGGLAGVGIADQRHARAAGGRPRSFRCPAAPRRRRRRGGAAPRACRPAAPRSGRAEQRPRAAPRAGALDEPELQQPPLQLVHVHAVARRRGLGPHLGDHARSPGRAVASRTSRRPRRRPRPGLGQHVVHRGGPAVRRFANDYQLRPRPSLARLALTQSRAGAYVPAPLPQWRNGRRGRLKICCRKACWFESGLGHQPSRAKHASARQAYVAKAAAP